MVNGSEEIGGHGVWPHRLINRIPLVVFNILISYVYYFVPEYLKEIVACMALISCVQVLFYFKKYLGGLQAAAAMKWVQRMISCSRIIALSLFIGILHRMLMHKVPLLADLPWLNLLLAAIYTYIGVLGTGLALTYVMLRAGLALQKVSNDDTGIINKIGTAYAYLDFTLVLCLIVIGIFHPLRVIYFAPSSLWLRLVVCTLGNVPAILLIALYYRSGKRRVR